MTTVSVRVLREAARVAGPPILPAIVGVAGEIFDSALNASQNRTAFQHLARRVSELVEAVTTHVDKLAATGTADLPQELLAFLDDLGYKLLQINEFVKLKLKQSRLKAFVFQERDATQLQAFQDDITNALSIFNTQSYIQMHSADALKIRADEELDVFQILDANARELEEHARQIKERKQSLRPVVDLNVPLPNLPPHPQLLFGRDDELRSVVGLLTPAGGDSARVCILGAPGIGKTSCALAVAHHPAVTVRYAERRIFIACDSAPDHDSLLALIGSTLGIKASSSAVLRKAVLKWLGEARTLLVLDNFETTWDHAVLRSSVEELLTALSGVHQLSLLVTLRGAERPSGVNWTRPFIPALAPLPRDAALQAFATISEIDDDPDLQELLSLADGIPLAIRLIASMAAYESCSSLLRRWNDLQTSLLNLGNDRSSSLEASITLSLQAPRMTLIPNAELLLSILSLLPEGVRQEDVEQLCDIPHAGRCVAVLLRTALAHRISEGGRVKVLAPIRAFMLHTRAPPASGLSRLYTRYTTVAEASATYPEMDESQLDIIAHELGNADSVLRHGLLHAPETVALIKATVQLSLLFQRNHLGSPKLIEAGLDTARRIGAKDLLVDCVLNSAAVYWGKRDHDRVQALVDEALELSKQFGYVRGEIKALGMLPALNSQADQLVYGARALELARGTNDPQLIINTLINMGKAKEKLTRLAEAKAHYAEAVAICRSLENPDASQFSTSLGQYGDILVVEGRVTEALPLFREGVALAQRHHRKIDEANCLRQIGTAHIARWEHRLGLKFLTLALDLYRAGGWAMFEVAALVHISWSQSAVGDVAGAGDSLDLAAECLSRLGNWAFGKTLHSWAHGDIGLYRQDHESARIAYRTARDTFRRMGQRDYEAEALKRMGFLDLVAHRYGDAETNFLVSAVLNSKTLEFINIAIALNRLADVWLAQGDEASAVNLSYAVGPPLVRLSSAKEVADIRLRFARVAQRRELTGRARSIAAAALRDYQELEWAYGVSCCQALLDNCRN
ncbi:hypothetical protein AURDEDRAFT_181557 [Auricularia subglabra TFB-10046 SS5]|nr:hypothetical protein AURDEDRAFT_181557 [Auricularia subglabra TFB-10046 SS5]